MLGGGDDFIRSAVVGTLKAADSCCGEYGSEVGIFARSFGNSSPTSIAGDVDHRRKCPVDSRRSCFSGGNRSTPFQRCRIPGRGLAQWDGKYSAITMNHIETK